MPLDAGLPMSRRRLLSALAGTAVATVLQRATVAAPAPGPADWPCFRGPNRNGVIPNQVRLLPGGPKQLWTA